jgi:hypothetical protein
MIEWVGDDQLIPQGVGHVIPHPGPLLLMIWLAPSCRQRAAVRGLPAGVGNWLIEGVGNYLIGWWPGAGRAARRAGQAWACPWFPARGGAEVSGVKAGPLALIR